MLNGRDREKSHAALPKSVFARAKMKINSGWGERKLDKSATVGPATEKVKTMTAADEQNNTETLCDG